LRRGRFSDAAFNAFANLKLHDENEPCTCAAHNILVAEPEQKRPCPSCDEWWELHSKLCDEVPGVPLWVWPIVIGPGWKTAFEGDHDARRRWGELDRALCERSRGILNLPAED
jgi:hypothetical protein